MKNIVFVTNYIPDYRYPVFERLVSESPANYWILTSSPLGQSCREARDHLRIKHSATINLLSKTRHPSTNTVQREFIPVPLGLFIDLLRIRPDVIISGDFGPRSLICWMTAKMLGSRFVIWSEEIASSAQGRSWLQRKLRKFLANRADACLAWGDPACSYLQSLGVEGNRIFHCAQAIDNHRWLELAKKINRASARAKLELSGVVFLLVGRMVERKGFRNFIQAWAVAGKQFETAAMAVIVGSGEQEAELRKLVADNKIANIRFAGMHIGDALAQYYAAADVFVFPSLEDVWGMVVNEALCFGLPVLGSKHAGASQQLLDGDAGIIFDPADIDEFSRKLALLARQRPSIHAGRAARMLDSVTHDRSVKAIANMLERIDMPIIGATISLCMLHMETHLPHWRRIATNAVFAFVPHLPQLRRIVTNVILCTC